MKMDDKSKEIIEVLSQDPVDMNRLQQLSRVEGGFVSNSLRSRVWPKLLGINRYVLPDYRKYVAPHRDDRQIGCDVDRSFWSLDVAKNWGERRLHRKRAILSDIITAVLCRHSKYYYFQGFHDIVSVLILVYNDSALAYATTEVLCEKYLFDFMRKDFSSLSKTMKMIMVLIKCADSDLSTFLESCCTEPFFSTSWLITWLSHDIRNIQQSARMFDVLICSPPEYCFYLCAAIVLVHRDDILAVEADFSTVHNELSRLLRKHEGSNDSSLPPDFSEKCTVDLEAVIAKADWLLDRFPPSEILRYADPSVKNVMVQSRLSLFSQDNSFSPLQAMIPDFVILSNLRLQNLALYGCLPSCHRVLEVGAVLRGWSADLIDRHVTGGSATARAGDPFVPTMWTVLFEVLGWHHHRLSHEEKKNSRLHSSILIGAVTGSVLSIAVWFSREYLSVDSTTGG